MMNIEYTLAMEKINLEEYLKDILEKVEKVAEAGDEQVIEDLTSYIHMSKDIIRYYKTTDGISTRVEEAYCKINEAEEKIEKMTNISRLSIRKKDSSLNIKEVLNTFIESLNIFSRA